MTTQNPSASIGSALQAAGKPTVDAAGSEAEPGVVRRVGGWLGRRARESAALVAEPLALITANRLARDLEHCFDAPLTDVNASARAREFMLRYLAADASARLVLLEAVAHEAARHEAARHEAHGDLAQLMESAGVRFLKRFNLLDGGLGFLVSFRADMLRQRKTVTGLDGLTADLGSLFSAWFDVGFLELRAITWDSPASLLEKLMRYEAVHPIKSWSDLRNRLDGDRLCYAFFHPRLPDEPLIFVEIALVEELSDRIGTLLDEAAPRADSARARWAVFYSISNTQFGLRGVSFGNFLLKRVIEAVRQRFPKLESFATLSPIPGFAAWARALVGADVERMLPSRLVRQLREEAALSGSLSGSTIAAWLEDETLQSALQRETGERLAAHFLARAFGPEGPLDPVARFHLGNGARIERLNWRADQSHKAHRDSFGMMVNYRYVVGDLDDNRARLANGTPRVGRAVARLL